MLCQVGLLDLPSLLDDRAAAAASVCQAIHTSTAAIARWHAELAPNLLPVIRADTEEDEARNARCCCVQYDAPQEYEERCVEGQKANHTNRISPTYRHTAAAEKAYIEIIEATEQPILKLALFELQRSLLINLWWELFLAIVEVRNDNH